jgi:MFS family permease
VPAYIIPFAFGNLLGPLLLGHLFDTVGRRPMITLCYTLSGVLLVGTGIGGVTGPALFGKLVETGKEVNVFYGYLLGALLMIAAGVAEWFIGVEAAGKSLEDVAKPLTTHEEEGEGAEAPA